MTRCLVSGPRGEEGVVSSRLWDAGYGKPDLLVRVLEPPISGTWEARGLTVASTTKAIFFEAPWNC